ncbi:hypothetical protein HMPREF3086_08195 [Dietzia sp. HMSC21D01]|nr:hypothetical protein HMPREF3086_08195 [Dietzia sp. HMSC21D01]
MPRGEVTATYGGRGGGAELAARGVLSAGYLRSGQARVLLAALLSVAEGAEADVDVDADADAETRADTDVDAAARVRREWSRFHLYN